MRKWRSLEIPADDEWAVNHQIVVPEIYIPTGTTRGKTNNDRFIGTE